MMNRASGILLHVSSLPCGHGIGDMGPGAYRWLNFLAEAKQQYWQILPLNPAGYGNSPYSSPSSFAGNPLFISLDQLVEDGLLPKGSLTATWNTHKVDFAKTQLYKRGQLLKAFDTFQASRPDHGYEQFLGDNPWVFAFADAAAAQQKCDAAFIAFQQYIFQKQWLRLRAHAQLSGIKIIGDLPMYVAPDDVECKQHPELFDRASKLMAGAPPCDVYPEGQCWGNPLYRWERHKEQGYAWWLSRLQSALSRVDVVRLDYFCGYYASWATNGKTGSWREGPRASLFEAVRKKFGAAPFIAEDLGKLTPEINKLRDSFGIMSTKVLQYAFDGLPDNPYPPENFKTTNCVVYTGTHDTDTVRGWYDDAPDYVRENMSRLGVTANDVSWDMIKLAAGSKANLMIVPYQDVLCLGREARFNTPGTVCDDNWSWRITEDQMPARLVEALGWLAKEYKRLPGDAPQDTAVTDAENDADEKDAA